MIVGIKFEDSTVATQGRKEATRRSAMAATLTFAFSPRAVSIRAHSKFSMISTGQFRGLAPDSP